MFHGYGTYTFGSESEWAGDKYVGEYKNNKKHGQGMYFYADGDKYEGNFENDLYNGYGAYTWKDGTTYVGDYKNHKRDGQGTYTYTSGAKYIGGYKNNQRSGQGTYIYADGAKEVGTWENGKLNGFAITYFADGTINQEGIFKNNKFQLSEKSAPNKLDNQKIINASSGSGFAVSSDGYVITNNHVIEGCQEVIVHTKEKDIKTRIVSFDPQNDLALLKGDFIPKTVFALSDKQP